MKRLISIISVLAVFLSLLSCLTPAQGASYSYNNGKKGTLCTALSNSAKNYYGSAYTYENLSGLSGNSLEAKLRERMKNGWSGNSYDALKTYFKHTDAYNGSSSSVFCFYSNTSVSSWNREHVWPQSKGSFDTGSSTAGTDVIHLRPTDNKANSTRSNLPYGEVTGGTYTKVTTSAGKDAGYISPAFYEPLDSVKGDVARTLLYVYTRWEERNLTDVIDSVDLLLKWCENDPVDEYEMKRNDICQEICGSRNVYVDYPEYCWRVFGKQIPTHMKTPSGKGNTCNNPQYDAVVTSPATCTGNGVKTYTCRNCEYSYTEVIPSEGHHYVNGECTVCGARQASVQYFKAASIGVGDEIVIFNPSSKKLITTSPTTYSKNDKTYDRLLGASATVAGSELTTSAGDVAVFKVEKSGNSYAFKTDDGRYLTCEESEFLTLESSPKSGTNKWTLEDSGTDGWYIKNTTTYYQDYQKNYAYIEYYYTFTTYGFKGTAGQAAYNMNFYKVSRAPVCEHEYRVTATRAASCLEKGYTSYQCSKCSDSYTVYTEALGHDYVSHSAQAATCTESGWEAYLSCSRCDYTTYQEIPAKGHFFVDGECARCGEAEDPCIGYSDIDRGLWYHGAVDYVIKTGLMGSTSTTAKTFEPNTKVSRAMIAAIMYRISSSPDVEYKESFPDVPDGMWFTKSVEWAAQNGLASGKSDGTNTFFDPNGNVTRQELAVFMKKLATFLGNDTSETADLTLFQDAQSVSPWAQDYFSWAVGCGLISGKSADGTTKLAPADNATRAELASILKRFNDNFYG